jgi:uncharacterized protein YcbX
MGSEVLTSMRGHRHARRPAAIIAGESTRTDREVVMEVAGLWRYPVKSLQGEPIAAARVEADGVVGDRRWGIRDQRTGRILTARRRPELLGASSTYRGDEPVITLPNGSTVAGQGEHTDRQLSEWLASPVSLVPSSGEAGRAEFFADATDDTSQAIEFTMPDGRYVDAAPILILTTASLRAAAGHYPNGSWDVRRFRPNILIDLEGDEWVEDSWVGRQIRIGAVTLIPTQPCTRCTMITRPQPGLDADIDVFRTLARHHGGLFGVWSDVVTPGSLTLGDPASARRASAPAEPGV